MTDHNTYDDPPAPPAELSDRGCAFWVEITEEYELDGPTLERLRQVCRLLDVADGLQAAVDADGVTVAGSTGQQRVNPAIGELRQLSATLDRLLAGLGLPDDEVGSGFSRRARAAAAARWSA